MLTNLQPNYSYHPLAKEPRSLRILRLEPSVSDTARVCAYLQNENLDRLTIPFAALSYEWGTAGDRCLISVDRAEFYVQRNLRNFLVHIRRTGIEYIWIDAICVDQNNLEERGHQVRLMQAIYQKASQVPVYLGDHADGSDAACQYFNSWVNAGRPTWVDALQTVHQQVFADVSALPLSKALKALRSRTYWSRLWIIQEIRLPRRINIFLYCGNNRVGLEDFDTLFSHVKAERALWKERNPGHKVPNEWFAKDESGPYHYRSIFHGDRDDQSIFTLIGNHAGSGCSDPRDRLFGLLSLSTDGQHVDPNYTLSRLDVFLEVICSRQRMNVPRRSMLLGYESTLWKSFQLIISPEGLLTARGIDDIVVHLDSELAYHTSYSSTATLDSRTATQSHNSVQRLADINVYNCRLSVEDTSKARVTVVDSTPTNPQHYHRFECTYQNPVIIGGGRPPKPAVFASRCKPELEDILLRVSSTSVGLIFRRNQMHTSGTADKELLGVHIDPALCSYVGWAIPICAQHCHDVLRKIVMDANLSNHFLHNELLRNVEVLPVQVPRAAPIPADIPFDVQVPARDIIYLIYSWSRDRSGNCECFWSDTVAGYDAARIAAEERWKQEAQSRIATVP